ncbi:MAG: hypothetical protein D8M57_07125 [Candidatus Scalindua sp. AMX11]|nr:MAG: hypothetical protein DWQ00_14695 [Candidatus Scalindua sp.]NOG85687.1 hypothetical protein [Planctomycetota bacterium]RZV82420.1 MAG: hypothetical protein EX341_09625 [Candidatus Scalindua sp. SCAELEC01]TDE65658.1 MAG: hypothetical protein D8M57_07125 [Candidatus Scalindua sp. AMX11]
MCVDLFLFRVSFDKASPRELWVPLSCGTLFVGCREQTIRDSPTANGSNYLLALIWQPAFCETHQRKAECKKNRSGDRFDADHFTLHGLWSQPKSNTYCSISNPNSEFVLCPSIYLCHL